MHRCGFAPIWYGHSRTPPTPLAMQPPPHPPPPVMQNLPLSPTWVMQYCMTDLLQAARASTKQGISPATAHRNANQFVPLQEAGIFFFSAVFIAAELGIPVYNVLMNAAVPVIPGFILVLVTSVVFLKLVSYVHCNWDLRYLKFLTKIIFLFKVFQRFSERKLTKTMFLLENWYPCAVTHLIGRCTTWVCASHDMGLTDACMTWVGALLDMCWIGACTKWVCVYLDMCLIDACTKWVGVFHDTCLKSCHGRASCFVSSLVWCCHNCNIKIHMIHFIYIYISIYCHPG